MKLVKARIVNYKCYRDTGDLDLSPGFNIFIGKNDAGKSALLEGLSLSTPSNPHRTLFTAPNYGDIDSPHSVFTVTYDATSVELVDCFRRLQSINIPTQPGIANQLEIAKNMFNDALLSGDQFIVTWQNAGFSTGNLMSLSHLPHHNNHVFNNIGYPQTISLSSGNIGSAISYAQPLAQWQFERTYCFRAERLNIAETGSRGGSKLEPNARNLGEVLNTLSTSRPSAFETLMHHVKDIFPHIAEVRSSLEVSNTIRVVVSTAPPSLDREDLGVALSHSGTGIGQVLAILYVVVTAKSPHIILIDEPQSFLHPGAVRKLFEILRTYSQHQYLITTHSPVALALSDDDRLFHVIRTDQGSVVHAIDGRDNLRGVLADVGVRFGDIFGADSILWVEGRTEEICFPEIIRRLGKKPLLGTVVLGVIATGGFQTRDASRAYEIYERLSSGGALLPPPIAFIFDRERLTTQQMDDITRRSRGLLRWLPCRMYENYLLHPPVIAALLSRLLREEGIAVLEENVVDWLNEKGNNRKYFAGQAVRSFSAPEWNDMVDGAAILTDLFEDLSGGLHRYNKVAHGIELTKLLLDNPTPRFEALAEFLATTLQDGQHAVEAKA